MSLSDHCCVCDRRRGGSSNWLANCGTNHHRDGGHSGSGDDKDIADRRPFSRASSQNIKFGLRKSCRRYAAQPISRAYPGLSPRANFIAAAARLGGTPAQVLSKRNLVIL